MLIKTKPKYFILAALTVALFVGLAMTTVPAEANHSSILTIFNPPDGAVYQLNQDPAPGWGTACRAGWQCWIAVWPGGLDPDNVFKLRVDVEGSFGFYMYGFKDGIIVRDVHTYTVVAEP